MRKMKLNQMCFCLTVGWWLNCLGIKIDPEPGTPPHASQRQKSGSCHYQMWLLLPWALSSKGPGWAVAFGKGAPGRREEGIQRHESGRVSGTSCQKLQLSKEGANDTGGDIMYERWRCREKQRQIETERQKN